ncbi:hypothetical protein C8J56DRAFT_463091 [Mycena floridula]|nr:hypothetical protein C8J56DRAFT_463091 [Mycena floridula]
MPSSYATQEDPATLWYEQSNYVSTHLAAMGYAVYAIVTYYTIKTRKTSTKPIWIGWLVFNTLLFALGTMNLATTIAFNQNAWINEREYPGGPFRYMIEQGSLPFVTLGNVASILASFLSDGLLLYRAGVLWNFTWYIVLPPAGFFVACIVLSILTVVQLALPNVHIPPLSLAVWIVLMILPIWLTALIAGRIIYHRRTMKDVLGPEYARTYTGIAAIVIESALPFTIISIILLGLFGDNNTGQNLLISLMVQVECIAPELIILRVVLGRSWKSNTLAGNGHKPRSEVEFAAQGADSRFLEDQLADVVGTQSTRSQTQDQHVEKDKNPADSTVYVVV